MSLSRRVYLLGELQNYKCWGFCSTPFSESERTRFSASLVLTNDLDANARHKELPVQERKKHHTFILFFKLNKQQRNRGGGERERRGNPHKQRDGQTGGREGGGGGGGVSI